MEHTTLGDVTHLAVIQGARVGTEKRIGTVNGDGDASEDEDGGGYGKEGATLREDNVKYNTLSVFTAIYNCIRTQSSIILIYLICQLDRNA